MTPFPGNKRFAFTIFDDTDSSTVENVGPVYRLLEEIGLLITKSVWPLANVPGGRYPGGTLQDRDYLAFALGLKERGFEIALHNVRNGDSTRDVVENGLAEFEERLGHKPRLHANHSYNRENIYWGTDRLSGLAKRQFYNCVTLFRHATVFRGHVPDSRYFWGDICRERITYVRNFATDEINLERINPSMPYRNPAQPYVNYWFSSCDGAKVSSFCHAVREENQDRLEAEGGYCIMYTHFGCDFHNGRLNPTFERLMRRLAAKNGWFVPVSTLLDYLRSRQTSSTIPAPELSALENRWLRYKLLNGHS